MAPHELHAWLRIPITTTRVVGTTTLDTIFSVDPYLDLHGALFLNVVDVNFYQVKLLIIYDV